MKRIVVIGAGGGIGGAFVKILGQREDVAKVYACSRTRIPTFGSNIETHTLDYEHENTIAAVAEEVGQSGPLDLVIVATGLLHTEGIVPEKSLRELSSDKFQTLFAANAIVPALIAKHFLPRLTRDTASTFAAISARVGSISDNALGGWYAYRASKAALNMVLKNAAIETRRRHPLAVVVGLHPGTVDSQLSAPFQRKVNPDKLFTPTFAATCLLNVIDGLTANDSGKCFAWDGRVIDP